MLQRLFTVIHQSLFDAPEHRANKPLLVGLRYAYALLRDLLQGQLSLRAMSLVYTTLLSVAPLLALAFAVLKGLGYSQYLEPVLYQFLQPIGDIKAAELTANMMHSVNGVRGGVLGSLGLALLLYTVISTIQKVEESFNFVWRVEQPRSWTRRIHEYLSVMALGPVLVVAAIGVFTALSRSDAAQTLTRLDAVAWLLHYLKQLTPFVLVSMAFTFVYGFVPNTRVRWMAALIGGVAAGALWTAGGVLFTRFVAGSTQTALIYAGFAIFIVALIWLYTSWLILLVGAQLSFYVQHPQSLRAGQREVHLTAALRERLGFSVMYLIARDFKQRGALWTLNSLSQQLDLPAHNLKSVLAALESHHLLIITHDEHYVPARDLHHIKLVDILDAVRNDTHHSGMPHIRAEAVADAVAHAAVEAQRDSVQGKTLAELIESTIVTE